jgi:integrase
MFTKGHIPAHTGRTTTTDPIKTKADLQKVKQVVQESPRDYAILLLSVGTALRAGDLCRLTWDDLYDNEVRLLEGKTGKRRVIPLNAEIVQALLIWRRYCESNFIVSGQRGPLTTATLGRLVKSWCAAAGLEGQFSAHSTRKAFVRIHHDEVGTSMATLMAIGNWSSERQVLTYMGRLSDDVQAAYAQKL